jgi:hypothetical protein
MTSRGRSAQHFEQEVQAIVETLIEVHAARTPRLPPVIPLLPLLGRVNVRAIYSEEDGAWTATLVDALRMAINSCREAQSGPGSNPIQPNENAVYWPLKKATEDYMFCDPQHDEPRVCGYDDPDAFCALAASFGLECSM